MNSIPKPSALIKPTKDTRFHIDYDWWDQHNEDLRTYLLSHVSEVQRESLLQSEEGHKVDYVHPETGEVIKLDQLQLAIREAAQSPDFITPQASLVDNVFRTFLANDNQPLTPPELAEKVGRPADVILRTIGGVRVYKGIRPYHEHS